MGCDLYQLRIFFVLARTLNFTEAAKRLYITQPAVSQALKKLEGSLGCELIIRQGRQHVLSDQGKLLYQACEDIFYRLEKTEESIRRKTKDFLGNIRLGATVEFGNSVLMKNMKKFLAEHDDIHVDFQFKHDLLPLLLSDELDVIIDCRDFSHTQLDKTPLFREKYVVVGAPGYVREHAIRRPKDLEASRVISLDKGGIWWERFLQALPERERPALSDLMELNHIRGIITAALEGIGVALVPKYCVTRELVGRRLKNIFPRLNLMEDQFYIYQKKKKSGLQKHRILVDYLNSIKPAEFGEP
jgi:DNA-binding transcriptional LysR family regulator